MNVTTGVTDCIFAKQTTFTEGEHTSNSQIESNFNEDCEDTIYTFDVSPRNKYIVTVHRSSLIRLWQSVMNDDGEPNDSGRHYMQKCWKSTHKGPVVKVCFSNDHRFICTSGSDSSIRIWDWVENCCVSVFREFSGPANLVKFHPDIDLPEIFAAGADNVIYHWNLRKKEVIKTMRGHISAITEFCFSSKTVDECYQHLVSVGRDKVLIVWRLSDGQQLKLLPIYEELVGVNFLSPNELLIIDCKGSLKAVQISSGKIINLGTTQQNSEIVRMIPHKHSNRLLIITIENNLLIFTIKPELLTGNYFASTIPESNGLPSVTSCLQKEKQLIGFNDEIIDICYLGKEQNYLAVATNSINLKIYSIDNEMDCKVFSGHSQNIITLSSPGCSDLLLSGGRDFSIRLWQLDAINFNLKCLAKFCNAHTSSVTSISFAAPVDNFGGKTAKTSSGALTFASVCQTGSLKLWSLEPTLNNGEETSNEAQYRFLLKFAAVAHEKEINSICFAPNNKIIATASQDKTVKLWKTDGSFETAQIATLRGHKRGVWCVCFSPVDQVLITTSSDCCIRLWSLADLTCLKRFDSSCSILKAVFIDHGKYIISTCSDGLIQVWSIKNNLCVQTLEGHEDRVWALAVANNSSKYFFSGAADSKLVRWIDTTEELKNENILKNQTMAEEEQMLQNCLNEEKITQKAFRLALKLNKPKVTYQILKSQQAKSEVLESWLTDLSEEEREKLFDHVKKWSTNSRHSQVANRILRSLLDYIMSKPEAERCTHPVCQLIESLLPYTQRHFKRYTDMKIELSLLELIVNKM